MQSRWRAIAVVAAAAIVAVALFLVLRDGGDSDSTTEPVTTSEAPTKKEPPKEKPNPKPEAGGTTIAFKNGAPVGGVQEIEASSGDQVSIRVTSDGPADVHVHGYELEGEAGPGEPATFDFRANAEGEFEIEAHLVTGGHEEEGVQIANLTVTP